MTLKQAVPLVFAAVVPLAGLLLTIGHAVQGEREDAYRTGFATLFGLFVYAAIFT